MIEDKADVVIIGGGVIGCSIAYNLASRGVKDVVLLERDYLASGATGRCGAGIRQQWGTEMNCKLAKYSMDIFENMNEILETRRDIELKQDGYLILAYSNREMEQFEKNLELQQSLDIPAYRVSPSEAKEIVPHLSLKGVVGGTFCPTDGHANPFRVTQAYAEAAERLGVSIYTYTEALDIETDKGQVTGVETEKGFIKTDVVVNAAGGYSKNIGSMVDIDLPLKPERHQILVTERVEPLQGPMVISFSYNIYCQQTPDGSFIMGFGDPDEPESHNINSSWQFLEEMAEKAVDLLPVLGNLRVIRQWAGLYNVTPDAQPILDEARELPGFYIAAGFSGHGFMIAPMTGEIMAQKIVGEKPTIDLDLTLNRFDRGELILEPSVV